MMLCASPICLIYMETKLTNHYAKDIVLNSSTQRFASQRIYPNFKYSNMTNSSECVPGSTVLDLNCSNIQEIKLGRELGSGYCRITFEGFFREFRVAVKFSKPDGKFISKCIVRKRLQFLNNTNKYSVLQSGDRTVNKSCFDELVNISKKEIRRSQELAHPVLQPLLGYCVRNVTDVPKGYDLNTAPIVSVWELGKPATGYEIKTWQ